MFRKILVANRGEIARRIIRAIHAVGAKAVAVYSEADKDAIYLQEADEIVCIGKGPASQSYLNQDAILEAAEKYACEAIHPGFGFLSENALFATRCEQQKLTFIGPKPSHMRLMGDKATARQTMQRCGLPVMPGSSGTLRDVQDALEKAEEVGYPILLKATAGGGGKGMRLVHSEKDMQEMFALAQSEALKSFSNPDLYMEKYIVGARHIEFQILADSYGHIIHLGERECSVQRNHQKSLEEAPAFGMSEEMRQKIGHQVCVALQKIGYQNAGTIEFLMDAHQNLYFMEMNTRIQVEHPVTELITGIDLVAWQIRIACGEHLALQQSDIHFHGHAIECRINAEDPKNNFAPSPGELEQYAPPKSSPTGPVRVETHAYAGYRVPPYYDSMLAKLIVHADTREQAVKSMQKALQEFRVKGVATTIPLHQEIMQHALFQKGGYTCQFLEQMKQ